MKSVLMNTSILAVLVIPALSFAQEAVPSQEAPQEIIIVTGTGVRQTQTLKSKALEIKAPGTSPIKLVERLPGVNYSGADAMGAYEWAVRINIRGFQQQQMGFTLDGIPLGDMSYGNFNGLHISRALISENLGEAKLSQGAGLLSTNSTSNLGGTLQFVSKGAAKQAKSSLAISGGDTSLLRVFGRFDSGEIESMGNLRLYVSGMSNEMEKWKGNGKQKQKQFNAGFALPMGNGEFSGLYSNSQRREADYQDLSKEMINRLGYNWDNFAPDWALAQRIADIGNNRGDTGAPVTDASAGTIYPAPIVSVDDAYYDASGLRDDELMRVGYKGELFTGLKIDGSIYHHNQEGQGLWFTPYVSPFSFGGGTAGVTSPISVRTTEYDMSRLGAFASLTYEIGAHAIEGGFWVEKNDFNQARRFYANTRSAPNDVMKFQRGAFATQWEFDYEIETLVFHLQDTWRLNDQLKLQAGFKSMRVDNFGDAIINTWTAPAAGSDADLKGTIRSEDSFLPQIGLTYELSKNYQFFGSYTENMRAFDLSPFSNRSVISFEAIKKLTNPESSKTLEGGMRFRGPNFQGVVAAYLVKFDDRLLGIRQGSGIQGNPSIISNVGGVETKGLEIAGNYKFSPELSVYASYSLNNSEYEDNVVDATGAVLQATKGKTVVNAPKHLFKTDLSYDNGSFFTSLSANYTGERESTFENVGGKIDAYTLVDFSVGYRFTNSEILKGLEVQLNINNLLDEEYISTIGTNGFSARAIAPTPEKEVDQTFMVGAPRQVFVTIRKSF